MYKPSPPDYICGVLGAPRALPGQEFEGCLLLKGAWWPLWSRPDQMPCALGEPPVQGERLWGDSPPAVPTGTLAPCHIPTPRPHAALPRTRALQHRTGGNGADQDKRDQQTPAHGAGALAAEHIARLPVRSRELVKAVLIKIAPNNCLSALSGEGSDPTSVLDTTSGGKQVASEQDWVKSAESKGSGGGHWAGCGTEWASAKGRVTSGWAHAKSP